MMDIQCAMRPAVETRAVNNVGNTTRHDRIVNRCSVGGIVFQISVLNNDYRALGLSQSPLQCGTLALVLLVKQHARNECGCAALVPWHRGQIAILTNRQTPIAAIGRHDIAAQPVGAAVGLRIVDDDDLVFLVGQRGDSHRQHLGYCASLAVGGGDDREIHVASPFANSNSR